MGDVTPDLNELIREGYQREAALLRRCDAAEAKVERLREAVEWAQLRGVAMNDAGLVVRMNYALNPQEADHE